jgi:3-phenylpropionate/trans-cinnamate dioxygenase ferredoxin reductase component
VNRVLPIPAVAEYAAGASKVNEQVPYFFYQYDGSMEYSGWPVPWDQVLFRRHPADGAFVAFHLSEGKLVGGANVNIGGVNDHVQRLLREDGTVDVMQLVDPDVALLEWRTSRSPAERPAAGC